MYTCTHVQVCTCRRALVYACTLYTCAVTTLPRARATDARSVPVPQVSLPAGAWAGCYSQESMSAPTTAKMGGVPVHPTQLLRQQQLDQAYNSTLRHDQEMQHLHQTQVTMQHNMRDQMTLMQNTLSHLSEQVAALQGQVVQIQSQLSHLQQLPRVPMQEAVVTAPQEAAATAAKSAAATAAGSAASKAAGSSQGQAKAKPLAKGEAKAEAKAEANSGWQARGARGGTKRKCLGWP